jgi:hypothetical protein
MDFNRLKARIRMTAAIGAVLLAIAGLCTDAGAAVPSGEAPLANHVAA